MSRCSGKTKENLTMVKVQSSSYPLDLLCHQSLAAWERQKQMRLGQCVRQHTDVMTEITADFLQI